MPMKRAVVYHYFEKNDIYKDNLIFFLSKGIFDGIDFFIIIAGECTVELIHRENIRYIYVENKNNDYGGYSALVKSGALDQYEAVLFVNSSVRGPFLPKYSGINWIEPFLSRLKGDVNLVGNSINIMPPDASFARKNYKSNEPLVYRPHVQTAVYALTQAALRYLMSIRFYDIDTKLAKEEVVIQYEIGLSTSILSNNWKIDCILPIYSATESVESIVSVDNFSAIQGDLLFEHAFFARTANPYELIFIKTKCEMILPTELASYTFTALYEEQSQISYTECDRLLHRSEKYLRKITDNRFLIKKVLRALGLRRLLRRYIKPLI